ncbi:MAG TPA: isocitrate lyase/phosphoenolpyruvate mutase family protein [Candidatus Acidoferrum sp.]|nr:isocitrate lyase/phosphoenolpyruvate mutase family protein [Candidatus Acidoferrum sp.]
MDTFEQPITTHPIGTGNPGSRENFSARRQAFRALHEAGCFVVPNPWDVGSARYLQHLGFPALATTSAGFAFSQGLPDSEAALTCERNLAYIADIAGAVDVPVNADFASGYGASPEAVADNVTRCIAAGVAGLSIEDSTSDPSSPLYDLPLAVERLRAAREAIDQSRTGVLLTARAECFLVGHPDPLRESVRRLQAFADAGADVLFAPGPHDPTAIKALVDAVQPKPINVLIVRDAGLTVAGLAALGVRRISVGGALALAAWTGFTRAAQQLQSDGSFAGFSGSLPYPEVNGFFAADFRNRQSDRRRTAKA